MKTRPRILFLFLSASLILLLLASCGPVLLPTAGTATSAETSATSSPTGTATLECPPEAWPCPADQMTLTAEMAPTLDALSSGTEDNLTAAMGLTLAAIPSNTPPAWATVNPVAGDLGWGAVYGTISDGITGLPLEGATVNCEHFSYTSPYPCTGTTTTNSDGIYSFTPVFFHDTDRITLIVEAPGYISLRFEQPGFTQPEFHANLGLFPETADILTGTPAVMCTPPPCMDGILVCGSSNGCLLGCGAVCLPMTPTP